MATNLRAFAGVAEQGDAPPDGVPGAAPPMDLHAYAAAAPIMDEADVVVGAALDAGDVLLDELRAPPEGIVESGIALLTEPARTALASLSTLSWEEFRVLGHEAAREARVDAGAHGDVVGAWLYWAALTLGG